MKEITTVDLIASRLEDIQALVAITTLSTRRDIAFSIKCSENRDRTEVQIHGQLGRKYGFDRANAVYPEVS